MYPCAGVLAETGRAPVPQALGALPGPARAGVLVLLDTPKSPTQLVALTGQGLGSVGRHLKILLDAGLVRRRRAGQSVLYYRTAAGDTVLDAPLSGLGKDSLPAGLMIAGRHFEYATTLGAACAVEAAPRRLPLTPVG